MPTHKYERITPAIADRWLQYNIGNRRVRTGHMDNLAEAMTRGDFAVNGDTVVFDTEGVLVDGQHRLMAIKQSNRTQHVLVVRDVEPDVRDTIDRNEGRTVSDALSNAGFNHTPTLSGAAKMVKAFEEGALVRLASRGKFQPRDAKRLIKQHPDLVKSVAFIMSHRRDLRRVYGSLAVWSGIHYILSRADRDKAYTFIEGVSTGVNLSSTDVVLILRNRLMDDRHNHGVNLSGPHRMALIIKAWNALYQGRAVKRLTWRHSKDKFPTIAGLPPYVSKPTGLWTQGKGRGALRAIVGT